MINLILIYASYPAIFIVKIITHPHISWLFSFLVRTAIMGIFIIPLLMDTVSFADSIDFAFSNTFGFVFGTIPFTGYDMIVERFGESAALPATILGIVYWIIMAVTFICILLEINDSNTITKRKSMTYDERVAYDNQQAAGRKNRPATIFDADYVEDRNEDLLFHRLTTNEEIIRAEVEANAIAKALRNNH